MKPYETHDVLRFLLVMVHCVVLVGVSSLKKYHTLGCCI